MNKANPAAWEVVGDIPDFPFRSFAELQQAVAARQYTLGVDPLAAAEWSDQFGGFFTKVAVTVGSLLLITAALTAVVAGPLLENYWLLLGVPVNAVSFYSSHPGSAHQRWVTLAGAISVAAFISFLLSGHSTPAVLVAYAALTFGLVRTVGFINNRGFRAALVCDEQAFVSAYGRSACSLKESKTDKVYSVSR